MAPARFYDAEKNPDGSLSFPGVPLADLEEEVFNSYPKWLQESLDASPLYRKTKPHKPAADAPDKAKDGDS